MTSTYYRETNNSVIHLAQAKPAESFLDSGLLKQKKGNLKGAIEDFTRAITINSNYAQAYNNRRLIHYYIYGNTHYAVSDYNVAIKINPKYAEAYNNRGLAKYESGDKRGAIEDYNQAIKINPNYAEAYFYRGLARYDPKYELAENEGALSDLRKAAQLFQQRKDTARYQQVLRAAQRRSLPL
jgi:tetratricopeptide (TPR) repeat protein